MKNIILAAVSVMMLMTSCGTTAGGAMTGAMFGGLVGSSIGGITAGYRGSDVGQLVGMVAGGVAGAAVAHANEVAEEKSYEERYAKSYEQDGYGLGSRKSTPPAAAEPSSYNNQEIVRSETPIYDDRISFSADTATNQNTAPVDTSVTVSDLKAASVKRVESATPAQVTNVRFINNDGTEHIAKGELVKISFEIRNMRNHTLIGLVPVVKETTSNKRLLVSPATMIETLEAGKAIRYTAYVSAQSNLKTGVAHFVVRVDSNKEIISNVVEFDIPLN